jgi:UDP-N-acetylmuramate--alanine ligase
MVTEIYAAGEDPLEGVSGKALAEGIEKHGHRHVRFVPDVDDVAGALEGEIAEGDLILTLGAGSVTAVSDRIAEVVLARAS